MYTDLWTSSHFSTSPFVDNVDLSCGVDFLRGTWDKERKALAIIIPSWDDTTREYVRSVLYIDLFKAN
jgi:hypothetical protein